MKKDKELLIIRHARSQYNIKETADLDSDITQYGEKVCGHISKFLQNNFNLMNFRLFTSPFKRCLQTANLIYPNLPYYVRPELREYLNHSGRSVEISPRKEEFPHFNWSWFDGRTFSTEQNEEFLNRMYAAYNVIFEFSKKAVVITHGLPALTLIKIATENINYVPIWDHSLDNASMTYIKDGRILWYGRNLHHEIEY